MDPPGTVRADDSASMARFDSSLRQFICVSDFGVPLDAGVLAAPFCDDEVPLGVLRALFDAAPLGVLGISSDGIIRYVNRRQCENSDLSAEFFVGKPYRPTFGPTIEKSGLLSFYDRLVATGVPFEATLLDYKRHVDGASMAFNLRGYRAGGWILLVTSIERALAAQQRHYLQLFENANDGIFVLSREARFTRVNRKFAEMVGVPIESMIGQTTEMFLPGRLPESLARVERIIAEGHLGPYELEINTPLGTKHVSLNGFALLEDGKPVGIINIARDVSAEHRQAEELRAARDHALATSRLKTAFLANMSHEIRTPLNVILGYNSIIADEIAVTGDQQQMLQAIERAGRRLEQTIASILDISRLEAGAFKVSPELVTIADVVERQIKDFHPLAQRKGLTISHQIDEPGAVVTFDRYCLDHALMNLLANAIKFTPSGWVRVEVCRTAHGDLVLRVRDSGIGIDATFLPRLGEPFVQEDNGMTRGFEGAGLGFALTRRYLEQNGARLSIVSEKGRGSVVTIHFAAAESQRRLI